MERNYRYVQDGNTIRKVYEFPERNDDRRRKQNREKNHRRTYRQEEKAPKMSLKITLLMAMSVILSVMSCINYLNAEADITETKNNITSLEKSIDTLVTQNDSVQYEIDSFVDVNYIIKTAMEELGMVMVSKEQIITYDSTRNEYMEQYGDVPEKIKQAGMGQVFRMNKDIGNKKTPIFTRKMKNKSIVLFLLVILMLFGLAIRMLYINSTSGENYTVEVLSQQNYSSTTLPYKRGDILDRNGMTLATSVKVYNLILDPKVMLSEPKYLEPTLKALNECFGYEDNTLRNLINENKTKSYIVYEKKLSYEKIEPFLKLSNDIKNNPNIKGVWFETEYERKYPYSTLACNVIGFTAAGNVGTWGIEEYYNSQLNGVDGREYGYVNSDNIMEKVTKTATDGYTVISTIDLNVQTIVEKYIKQWKEEYNPDNVGVIVMNPQNGEIYAMATDTNYDLNNPRDLSGLYTEEQIAAMTDEETLNALNQMWRNYCLNDSFEPGSTYKPFTVAEALEEGKITESQTFVCDGSENVGGFDIGCSRKSGHGTVNASQSIAYSCNDALMQIGAILGVDLFTAYQDRFNFGMKTGIDLPGEASCEGLLFTKDNMKPINLATSSFGQSFNVTMVQLATGFCSLINGGYYYQPHVVKEIVNARGGVVEEVGVTPLKQNITKKTSDIVKAAMVDTIEEGTGSTAAVNGYIIGGKTGTAEKLPRGNEEYVYSFIGFADYENPQVVCYTVIDNPKGENITSSVSSKLFSSIMTEVLPYLQVFPDAPAGGDNGNTTGEPSSPAGDNPNVDIQGEPGMNNIPQGA